MKNELKNELKELIRRRDWLQGEFLSWRLRSGKKASEQRELLAEQLEENKKEIAKILG